MPMSIDRRRLLGGSAAVGLVGAFPRRLRAQEPRTKIRVGLVRLISSGPIFIAEAKNYFEKVNLDVELKYFADGALAMPALVAGELDLTASTLNAGLFNAVSKGAPYKLILDRGIEKPGSGSMTIVASNAMHEAGYTSTDKAKLLKGKKIAIQAPGSIDQYLFGRAAEKAGLDPTKDLDWSSGMPFPT
jgi:NitT/TauT family transport system substrate-binding protein